MEDLFEPIRYAASLFAIATAIGVLNAFKGDSARRTTVVRLTPAWLLVVGGGGWYLSHVVRSVPAPALVPVGAALGLALGSAMLFSRPVVAAMAALEDGQWRMLMLLRAVFGALILAAGAAGLLPAAFTLPAGVGDLIVGGLAVAVPGSIAVGGHRGWRLMVFGVGLVDFISVAAAQVLVLVPWLAASGSIGLSLLLPWIAVPLMATINLLGLRLLAHELTREPATSA
jgi:hypothetical protein